MSSPAQPSKNPSRWRQVWNDPALVREADDSVVAQIYLIFIGIRFLLAFHAIGYNLMYLLPVAAHPSFVVVACVVILGWTVYFSWHMREPANRNLWDHAADLGITLAVIGLTPVTMGGDPTRLTLAGYWMAGCMLYAGVFMSPLRGVAVGLVACAGYLMVPPPSGVKFEACTLALVTTVATSYAVRQLREAIKEREREQSYSAALKERERLFRIVHDGALQVLALAEREATSFGVKGVRLAKLARESETQLRSLLQDRTILPEPASDTEDLAAVLAKYRSSDVTVSTMADQVQLATYVVDEVDAAVTEMLTNVARHAGDNAKVWILLDQESPDEVMLWVRDNGVGMESGAVERAVERGRMGIKDSIVGRIAAVGGSATLTSTPGQGTEWEVRIPVGGAT